MQRSLDSPRVGPADRRNRQVIIHMSRRGMATKHSTFSALANLEVDSHFDLLREVSFLLLHFFLALGGHDDEPRPRRGEG